MKRILWVICVFFLLGCAGHRPDWKSPYRELSSLEEGDIVHLPTGIKASKEQLIDVLAGARIIYVGETHDNINSHRVQIEILKALAERYPGQIAVGVEMLQRSSQESADQWISGKLDEKDFVRLWLKNWSNDFQYYRSILRYMREHKIPLVALRASDEWLERIKETESNDQAKRNEDTLPQMDLQDPYHRAHMRAIFDEHPMGGQSFETFYSVQVLWDESMAKSIAEYLQSKRGHDKRILIFAGSHHIQYGFGVPRRVFRRLALPYTIVLPMTVHVPPEKQHKLMAVTLPEIPLQPGDFAWIISYEDLSDQKVYLGVIIRDTEHGVKVLGTMKNSTAQKAGVQKNDIITALDGEPIATKLDLTYVVGLKRPREKGVLEVLRDGKPLRFELIFQAARNLRTSP